MEATLFVSVFAHAWTRYLRPRIAAVGSDARELPPCRHEGPHVVEGAAAAHNEDALTSQRRKSCTHPEVVAGIAAQRQRECQSQALNVYA